ncbi:MAG: glycosyltransferase family 39 protein [Candidatus Sumerlaeaceae bacterium]|nr:glycosyltransferase family 39 protein [Candidatus Sumerlaeaceae bacterium]
MTRLRELQTYERWALFFIVAVALALRLWKLNEIPPGLWYDEALYCLNALSIRPAHWPIFFMLHGHPVEPLYVYSLAIAFSLFGAEVIVARTVSALWGTAAVALFYPVARRLVGERWALAGCLVYAVFRWPLHFSRTIFRALTPPVFVLLVVLFFLRWRRRRRMSDAILCGAFLGVGMYTYISFRLVPILFVLWIAWLFWRGELVGRRDGKAIGAIAVTALLVFAPLAVDFLKYPEHFSGRLDEVSMFHDRVEIPAGDGRSQIKLVSKPWGEILRGLAKNAVDVAGVWTFRGDHVGRHNLPYAPVFDWVSGIVFYLGIAASLRWGLWRENAFLPLIWLFVISSASIFSYGAPNILRMQAAIPAVVLLYVRGLIVIYDWAKTRFNQRSGQAVVASLLLWFSAYQLDTYFRRFASSAEVRNQFLADTFYEPAVAVRAWAEHYREIWVSRDLAEHLTFQFVTKDVRSIRPFDRLDDAVTSSVRPALLLISVPALTAQLDDSASTWQRLVKAHARLLRGFRVGITSSDARSPTPAPFAYLWELPAEPMSGDSSRR